MSDPESSNNMEALGNVQKKNWKIKDYWTLTWPSLSIVIAKMISDWDLVFSKPISSAEATTNRPVSE